MRVAAYYRVSSAQQRDKDTIAGQKAEVRALVTSRGWDLVAEFADDGKSARTRLDKRTGFTGLLETVRTRKVDGVVCVAFDRVTRAEDLAEQGAILGTLQTAGVVLVTGGGEETDLGTFGGRISALVRGQLAAEESKVKSDRSKRGRREAAKNGKNPGRPPFGYSFDGAEWTAPGEFAVRGIYEFAAWGHSCAVISEALNLAAVPSKSKGKRWDARMVCHVLTQHKRKGGDCYVSGLWLAHPKEPAIKVPAIVLADIATRARAMTSARANRPPVRTKNVSMLDERAARCGVCGAWIRAISTLGRRRADGSRDLFRYYVCENRRKARALGIEACSLPLRRIDTVDAKVWARVMAWAQAPAVVRAGHAAGAASHASGAADLDDLRQRVAAEEARLGALAEALGSGAVDAATYATQAERVRVRRDGLATQVTSMESATTGPEEPSLAELGAFKREIAAADDAGPQARRALVRKLWPAWRVTARGVEVLRSDSAFTSPR